MTEPEEDNEAVWRQVDAAALSPLLAPTPALLAAALARPLLQFLSRPRQVPGAVAEGLWQVARAAIAPDDPGRHDRRFADPSWQESVIHRRLAAMYLSGRSWFEDHLDAEELDDRSMERAKVALSIVSDALSPTNFPVANARSLRQARATRGSSVAAGLRHIADDILRHGGLPAIADRNVFAIGRNLATTPGAVRDRTSMYELVHYHARDAAVRRTPVLFVPSQINKFYIVDLADGMSMVGFLLDQGFDVFALSWRSPGEEDRGWSLDAYVDAARRATDSIIDHTGVESVHLVGMCAGAVTAAIAATVEEGRVASFTSLVGMLDTEAPSTVGSFVTPATAAAAVRRSSRRGVVPAHHMNRLFTWAKSRELFWTPVENNYLLGLPPPAHPVMFWSQDAVNLSGALHADLLDLLVNNRLSAPDGLAYADRTVGLRSLSCDSYFVAGSSDHIVPAGAVLRSAARTGGSSRVVVADGGHIRALLSGAPSIERGQYAVVNIETGAAIPELGDLAPVRGGWWNDWLHWLIERSPGERASTNPAPASPTRWGSAPGIYAAEIR